MAALCCESLALVSGGGGESSVMSTMPQGSSTGATSCPLSGRCALLTILAGFLLALASPAARARASASALNRSSSASPAAFSAAL